MLDPDEAYARKLQHMYEMENKYRLNSLRCAGSGNEYNTRKRKRVGNNSSHSGSTSWTMSDSITWKKAGLCICEDLTRLCVITSYHWPIWDIGTFVGRLTKLLIGLWVVFYCHVTVNRLTNNWLRSCFPLQFLFKSRPAEACWFAISVYNIICLLDRLYSCRWCTCVGKKMSRWTGL